MTQGDTQQFYRFLNRAFYLIWIGFPFLIWFFVRQILAGPDLSLFPGALGSDCAATLPSVTAFSPAGRAAFWTAFGVEFAYYAGLLAVAHRVIARCAAGQVFVEEMTGLLRILGLAVTLWPVVELIVANAAMAVYAAAGDVTRFEPELAPDLTVLGFGLLLLTIAGAIRQATALKADADLTI